MPMACTKQSTQVKIHDIERRIILIKSDGAYLSKGHWISWSAPAETASGEGRSRQYARLRFKRNLPLASGKNSQYIPMDQVKEVEEAIARGREIDRLEKELKRWREKLEANN